MKICNKCNNEKELSDFHNNRNICKSCRTEYNRAEWERKLGKIPLSRLTAEQRVLKYIKINEKTNCWEWQRGKNKAGYGVITYKGEFYLTHVLMYISKFGEVGKLCVLHECDNPPCCNPEHLFKGTRKENNDDKLIKNRQYRPIGELNSSSKLTEKKVIRIKKLLKKNKYTQQQIADHFSITQATVSEIKLEKTWKHIII